MVRLVVSSIYFFSVVVPQESDLRKLKERAETLQTQALSKQTSGDAESGVKMSGDQALQAFYDFFPRVDSSPFWIRELVRIAQKHRRQPVKRQLAIGGWIVDTRALCSRFEAGMIGRVAMQRPRRAVDAQFGE